MKKNFSRLLSLLIMLLFVVNACEKDDPKDDPKPKSMTPGKQISYFKIVNPAVTGVIDTVARTITVTVPVGTALTELTTDISVAAGHTISPNSGAAQNFTNPVTYTVTKPDNTTTTWTVKVGTAVVNVSQDITASVTWTADKVYVIDTEIEIKNASVLTIQPGTVIKFGANGSLAVGYGSAATVLAEGTADKPIIFTSSALLPAAGAWEGITFYDGTLNNSVLSYCQILYAGKNTTQGALNLLGCDIKMNNCTIDNSGSFGVYTTYSNNKGGFVAYENNAIKNTVKYAMVLNAQKIGALGAGNTFVNAKGVQITGDFESTTPQTWQNLGVPYIVTDEVEIDGALTIAPGTTFRFDTNGYLSIGYTSATTFIADGGAATTPITFTSNAASPVSGAWRGLVIYEQTQPTTKFNYCLIDYAGLAPTNMGAVLMSGAASVIFTNNTIRHSAGYGINCSWEGGFESFSNNTITDCANHLITISTANLPDIGTGNTLTAASGKGIEVSGNVKYTAPVTWRKQTADYYVKGGNVDVDGMITIEPGCKFLFVNDTYFWFGYYENTKITAVGTAENKITFTTSSVSPVAGLWRGLIFDDYVQTNSSLDYCVLQYTGLQSKPALSVSTQFNVSNTSILDHSGTVKASYSTATAPTGAGNDFTWTAN